MASPNDTSIGARKGHSPLRGPLLALILQRPPTHAYKLAGMLGQWLPAWGVARSALAELLAALEAEGVIGCTKGQRKLYYANDRTEGALDDWMDKVLSQPPIRDAMHAMIAGSGPQHAELLQRALDAYIRQCLEQLATRPGPEPSLGSWRSLTVNLTHAAADEQLHAKIKWAQTARKRIIEFSASR
jgi:hypothetical protein